MKLFKDYEYGWYGYHMTYTGIFMHSEMCHNVQYDNAAKRNFYSQFRNNTLKQIDKIQDVKFISGDYKEVI